MATVPTFPGVLKLGSKNRNVTRLQKLLNDRYHNHLDVDGDFGPETARVVMHFQAHRGLLPDGVVGPVTWARLYGVKIKEPKRSLAQRAFAVMQSLEGVLEVGGNNRGPVVSKIIRENGGVIGEPWCGNTVAYCYRHAGSKAVNRSWASVYFLGRVLGVVRTTTPFQGCIVRYKFSHTGLFERWDVPGRSFYAIEGNTGTGGSRSDGARDGVHRRHRTVDLVTDFRRVTK